MNLIEKIFGDFDFSSLNDPEFKEDAVREDIVAPLLRSIGYKASGNNKMIRSKSLVHPYVMFGSQKRKVNIVPDYVLSVDEKPCFVLDAKAPDKEVTKGDNVAQVYSYAIHPEIRTWNYGLCNGRSLALFEITSIEPKYIYDLTSLNEADIHDINQKLNPRTVANSSILGYLLDGGTYLHFVMDLPLHMEITFASVPIPIIGIVAEDHYTINVACTNMADRELMFTFDFNKKILEELVSQLSEEIANEINQSLLSFPYKYQNNTDPPITHIKCKQSNKPTFSNNGEMFFPLEVIEFKVN